MTHRVWVTNSDLYGKHHNKQPYFWLIGIQDADKDYILDSVPLSLGDDEYIEREKLFDQLETVLKYISRSLPCGFSILGLSTISGSNMEKNILTPQVVQQIFKRYLEQYTCNNCWKRAILLTVHERKPSCSVIDLQNGGKSIPCKLKDSNRVPSLVCLEAVIDVDWTLPYDSDGNQRSVLRWLSETKDWFCTSLHSGLVSIDGCFLCHKNQSDEWIPTQDRRQYQVEVFVDQWFPNSDKLYRVRDSAIRLRAQVPCRVYLLGTCSGSQIISLFAQDWKQAFETIVEVALEEFGASAFDLNHSKMIWNLPRRIFVESAMRKVPYCDYILAEESRQNVQDRLTSLLHFSSKEWEQSQLCFFEQSTTSEMENLPSASTWQWHSSKSQVIPAKRDASDDWNRIWVYCIVLVIFAILCAAVWRKKF
jgi:hypothetical protein